MRVPIFIISLIIIFSNGCFLLKHEEYPLVDRNNKLPADITKVTPDLDQHPPLLHSNEFEQPVPVQGGVNTKGAEDSPFILPDGKTLYFFFTPDVRGPVEKQILDSVTGVWVSEFENGIWEEAKRVWLIEPGKISLDGAVCVEDTLMWFASVREGYEGVNMFTAEFDGEKWINCQYCGDLLMKDYKIGEVHLHKDTLYFHSTRDDGKGGLDIWYTVKKDDGWSEPINFSILNTQGDDGFPFISKDGNEFWFSRTYMGTPAIFRSKKINNNWGEPELMVSQFAGEPTLDEDGNLYFVHHFFRNDTMIEADIYFSKRK
ncbi:MAG: hypothetical protein WHT27_05940 [candidate division WOR-3 bacterium]